MILHREIQILGPVRFLLYNFFSLLSITGHRKTKYVLRKLGTVGAMSMSPVLHKAEVSGLD